MPVALLPFAAGFGFARVASSSTVAPLGVCPSATSHSPSVERCVGPCNPAGVSRHHPKARPAEAGWASRERSGPPTGVSTERPQRRARFRERPFGAPPDRHEPTSSERCSDRESVLECSRLGVRSSRCSPGLFPLRGLPAQPLGSRPPLVCLLRAAAARPKTSFLGASPHSRVSIRLHLGAAPKTGSSPLEVLNLFRHHTL
jgi:hypothetical protein